jgi:hypothetical protein
VTSIGSRPRRRRRRSAAALLGRTASASASHPRAAPSTRPRPTSPAAERIVGGCRRAYADERHGGTGHLLLVGPARPDLDQPTLHPAADTDAGRGMELGDRRQRPVFAGGGGDRAAQRMLRGRLDRARQAQELVGVA